MKILLNVKESGLISLLAVIGVFSFIGVSYAATDIGSGDDVFIDLTKKLYFDGSSGNTYIKEGGSNVFSFFTNDAEVLRLQDTLVSIIRKDNTSQFRIYTDRGLGQDPNEAVAQIVFRGNLDSGAANDYGRFRVLPSDVTAGSHDGFYQFEVAQNGVLTEYIRLDGGNENIQLKKGLTLEGHDLNLAGANILSNGDICIGACP